MAPAVSSAKMLIGHPRAGVCRRPVASTATWEQVARLLTNAHTSGTTVQNFGVGFCTSQIKASEECTYVPSAIARLHQQIRQRAAQVAGGTKRAAPPCEVVNKKTAFNITSGGPCHFGHLTTSGRRGGKVHWHCNPPVSFWPGKVPGLVALCSKCYQQGYRSVSRGTLAVCPQFDNTEDVTVTRC